MTAQPTPPHLDPGKKENNEDLTPQEKTIWSVLKMLIDGPLFLKEPNSKRKKKKSTMPVLFPLNIYTLDSKPCSHKVENRYDKTWLEK